MKKLWYNSFLATRFIAITIGIDTSSSTAGETWDTSKQWSFDNAVRRWGIEMNGWFCWYCCKACDTIHLWKEMPCWPVPVSAQLSTPIHTRPYPQKYDRLTKMFFRSTNMKPRDSMVQLQQKHNQMQILRVQGMGLSTRQVWLICAHSFCAVCFIHLQYTFAGDMWKLQRWKLQRCRTLNLTC